MRSASILAFLALSGTAAPVLAQVASTDEAQASRSEILADASSRTSLLTNADAGERTGLEWRQGNTSVNLGGMLQFRYTANVRDAEGSQESFTHGFSIPRARLWVNADLNETWSVYLQGNFDSDGGTFVLLDAWADWKLDENWTLRGGQFKVPSLRTWNTPEQNTMAADRSVTNLVFNAGRTQGIAAVYVDDRMRFVGAFDDGAGTLNTQFNAMSEADYAFTGRFDWKFMGDWSQLDQFHGWRGSEQAALLGGFAHYQDGGSTGAGNDSSTNDVALFEGLVDGQWQASGWSAYGALIYQYLDPAGIDALNNFGVILQGAAFVSDADELFARYDIVIPDGDTPGGDSTFNTLTFGWNHFFIPESEASRFTLDLQWFLNATADNGLVTSIPSIGLLESNNEGQIAIRAQYQAVF